ncbi:MAG: pyridoxamine 5'-phosphate oxidase [Alphaproteobacteria bacterium]
MKSPDPIRLFRSWFASARRAGIASPEAMALATADRRGRPSVRFVLLKGVDPDGFVFYTNADSRKGGELAANPRASLAFYWQPLARQVRVEGRIERVTDAEADAYWATRPRESRFAGSVSRQSRPLRSRADLVARWRKLVRETGDGEIPRPRNWTGFRLVPDAIELWRERPHRLHEREFFERTRTGWKRTLLDP